MAAAENAAPHQAEVQRYDRHVDVVGQHTQETALELAHVAVAGDPAFGKHTQHMAVAQDALRFRYAAIERLRVAAVGQRQQARPASEGAQPFPVVQGFVDDKVHLARACRRHQQPVHEADMIGDQQHRSFVR